MTVNTSARVANLNADRVDGKSASAFLPSATYKVATWLLIPANTFQTVIASCDAGDVLLGGGFWNVDPASHVWDSYPAVMSWLVGVKTGAVTNQVYAYAVCADLGAAHVTVLSEVEPQRDE
jgi:hypothetical protein